MITFSLLSGWKIIEHWYHQYPWIHQWNFVVLYIYILLILSAIHVLFDKLTSWRSFKWGRFIHYVKTKKKLNTWCLTFELWKLLLWFPLMDLYLWLLTDWDGTFVWEHQWCLDCELWLLGISPVKSAVRSQGKPNTPQSLRHEGWI